MTSQTIMPPITEATSVGIYGNGVKPSHGREAHEVVAIHQGDCIYIYEASTSFDGFRVAQWFYKQMMLVHEGLKRPSLVRVSTRTFIIE